MMEPLTKAQLYIKAQYDTIFPKPSDPDHTVLWRYFSTDPNDAGRGNVDKFATLIKNSSLWLTKASTLPDKLEVRSTEATRLDLRRIIEQEEDYDEAKELKIEEEQPSFCFVNCWHRNDAEAICMWAEYCGVKQGIVVRTTFAKLEAACNAAGEQLFFVGCIKYIDRSTDIIQHGNPFYPCMCKDQCYGPENEVRIAALRVIADKHVDHIDMPIDLVAIVDAIYVHPLARNEYFGEVTSLLQLSAPQLSSRLQWSDLKGHTTLKDFIGCD